MTSGIPTAPDCLDRGHSVLHRPAAVMPSMLAHKAKKQGWQHVVVGQTFDQNMMCQIETRGTIRLLDTTGQWVDLFLQNGQMMAQMGHTSPFACKKDVVLSTPKIVQTDGFWKHNVSAHQRASIKKNSTNADHIKAFCMISRPETRTLTLNWNNGVCVAVHSLTVQAALMMTAQGSLKLPAAELEILCNSLPYLVCHFLGRGEQKNGHPIRWITDHLQHHDFPLLPILPSAHSHIAKAHNQSYAELSLVRKLWAKTQIEAFRWKWVLSPPLR